MTASQLLDTPLGRYRLSATDAGIVLVAPIGDETLPPASSGPVLARRHLSAAALALDDYFSGRRHDFSDLVLAPRGTPFQQRVWAGLRAIPFGETLGYAALARAIGCPRAARAVGHANGSNPLAILLPCHRVIGTDGRLTGYAGGLWRKRWLLEHERALPASRVA